FFDAGTEYSVPGAGFLQVPRPVLRGVVLDRFEEDRFRSLGSIRHEVAPRGPLSLPSPPLLGERVGRGRSPLHETMRFLTALFLTQKKSKKTERLPLPVRLSLWHRLPTVPDSARFVVARSPDRARFGKVRLQTTRID